MGKSKWSPKVAQNIHTQSFIKRFLPWYTGNELKKRLKPGIYSANKEPPFALYMAISVIINWIRRTQTIADPWETTHMGRVCTRYGNVIVQPAVLCEEPRLRL
jgi:hypothetical protein